MPRVYGGSPGKPSSVSGSKFGKLFGVYRRSTGVSETVVNESFVSGDFFNAGRSVRSSHVCCASSNSLITSVVLIGVSTPKNSTAQQRRSDPVSKRDDSLATFTVSTFEACLLCSTLHRKPEALVSIYAHAAWHKSVLWCRLIQC